MTTATILVFVEVHRLSVHVLWGETKVTSHTAEDSVPSLRLYVHGDHAYYDDDPNSKSVIAKTHAAVKPHTRSEVVLKVIAKKEAPPFSEWAQWDGELLL